MLMLFDHMNTNYLSQKIDYLSIICDVNYKAEDAVKQNISILQKLPFVNWFNCKEHFKNGVLLNQVQIGWWLKIQCCPASGVGHKIKISFNFHTDAGLQSIAKVINDVVLGGWEFVVTDGRVSRIDLAIDFKNVTPAQFVWLSRHNYKKSNLYIDDSNQRLETIYMGSVSSELYVVVYDRKSATKIKGKFPEFGLENYPDFDVTRIEIRHQPKLINQTSLKNIFDLVSGSLSKVHVMKARFSDELTQQRLTNMLSTGSQRLLLKSSSYSMNFLEEKVRASISEHLLKKSLFEHSNGFTNELNELINPSLIAA